MQSITLMDMFLKIEGLDLNIVTYKVMACNTRAGFIELFFFFFLIF
jgi:phosphatidylinositol kinase/protein kinase (PI-3  family)